MIYTVFQVLTNSMTNFNIFRKMHYGAVGFIQEELTNKHEIQVFTVLKQ